MLLAQPAGLQDRGNRLEGVGKGGHAMTRRGQSHWVCNSRSFPFPLGL